MRRGLLDDGLEAGVHCVRTPARLSRAANATFNIRGFQFDMKHQIDARMSTERSRVVGGGGHVLGAGGGPRGHKRGQHQLVGAPACLYCRFECSREDSATRTRASRSMDRPVRRNVPRAL